MPELTGDTAPKTYSSDASSRESAGVQAAQAAQAARVLLIRREGDAQAARAHLTTSSCRGWERVHIREIDLTDIGQLRDQLPEAVGEADPVVLAWLADDEPNRVVRQLADLLCDRHLPAVVVWSGVERLGDELRSTGIVGINPTGTGCGLDELYGVLSTLACRQPAVASLAVERRLSQQSALSMRQEIDQLHEEMQLAAHLQREFMPETLPSVDGLELARLFRPVGYVSGDIYDAVVAPDGSVVFFLADAVGHGVSAALLTIAVSRTLRDPASMSDPDAGGRMSPGAALSRLNIDMCTRWRASRWFVTAVCGRYDPKTHEVTLASAGHPHPILTGGVRVVHPADGSGGIDGEAVSVDAVFKNFGGPLLGVFEEAVFDERTLRLDPGGTLLVYSDGFEVAFPEAAGETAGSEVSRAGQPPSTKRYLDELAAVGREATAHGGLAGSMQNLEARLDQQSGSLHQADDLTVLAFRRTAA